MRVLTVYAHQNPNSFCHAVLKLCVDASSFLALLRRYVRYQASPKSRVS